MIAITFEAVTETCALDNVLKQTQNAERRALIPREYKPSIWTLWTVTINEQSLCDWSWSRQKHRADKYKRLRIIQKYCK